MAIADRGRAGWAWPALIVAALLAIGIAATVWFAGDGALDLPGGGIRGVDRPAASTGEGIERGLLLHAINPGSPATARISLPGTPVRAYRVGGVIAPGLVVRAIGTDRVEVDANGRRIVLTIDAASGRPGDRAGLDAEPVAPSGELPGAEIERRIRAQGQPVRRLPEEDAAGSPR